MVDILKKSLALKATYKVNTILYSLKQIPLIKRLLPDALYQSHALKVFAKILLLIWGIISTFLGKLLYFIILIQLPIDFFAEGPQKSIFLHILVFCTIIGAILNTQMFDPSKQNYYAIILMRMDARSYTLVNYYKYLLKTIIGFLPFVFLFGALNEVPVWVNLLILLFVAGIKVTIAAIYLWDYKKNEKLTNGNSPRLIIWIATILLLALAYGLPALYIVLPVSVSISFMVLCVFTGIAALVKVQNFKNYLEMFKQLYAKSLNQMNDVKKININSSRKTISNNTQITSNKKGFEYLNEIFVKRHWKILWKASIIISIVCALIIIVLIVLCRILPDVKNTVNQLLMSYLPFFVFIMYILNRGIKFTRTLFINCDNSLFSYSVYKQPKYILKLFVIRLIEITKVNLLPAAVIATGLLALLLASGGTDNPVNYFVIFVSIISLSVFFSVHYLTLYYLLQPYNAKTETKSGTYSVAMFLTYFVCYFIMRLEISTLTFGLMTIMFCVTYSIIACILVYKLAPKTFKLRY